MRPDRESCLNIIQEAGSIHGWIGESEGMRIYKEAYCSDGNVLEIGCYMGKSSFLLARGIKDSGRENVLLSIDIHKRSYDSDSILAPEAILKMNEMVDKNYLSRYIVQLIGWSHICIPLLDFNNIKTIFVDGDHRYESCKRDLELIVEHIRKDIPIKLMIHDYHPIDAPEIIEAVDEVIIDNPRYHFEEAVDRTFICVMEPMCTTA